MTNDREWDSRANAEPGRTCHSDYSCVTVMMAESDVEDNKEKEGARPECMVAAPALPRAWLGA